MPPYRIKDHPPDPLVLRVHPRSLECRISLPNAVMPFWRNVKRDPYPLRKDLQTSSPKRPRQPWTKHKFGKSSLTSPNSLTVSGAHLPLIVREDQTPSSPRPDSIAYLKTPQMLRAVPLLKRIWSPECQELGGAEMNMRESKKTKIASPESESSSRISLRKIFSPGEDPAFEEASSSINTRFCLRSIRPSAPGTERVEPGKLFTKISSINPENHCFTLNNGKISSQSWPVSLDRVLDRFQHDSITNKISKRVGAAKISFNSEPVGKGVSCYLDWVTAWDETIGAYTYIWPNRDQELRAYRRHISSLFHSFAPVSHSHVIKYDQAIRTVATETRSFLFHQVEFYPQLDRYWLTGAFPASSSNDEKSKHPKKRSSAPCRNFNLGVCSYDALECSY